MRLKALWRPCQQRQKVLATLGKNKKYWNLLDQRFTNGSGEILVNAEIVLGAFSSVFSFFFIG
jgi:hypothetical protein